MKGTRLIKNLDPKGSETNNFPEPKTLLFSRVRIRSTILDFYVGMIVDIERDAEQKFFD